MAPAGALVSLAPSGGQFSMCKRVGCFLSHGWHVVRCFLHVLLRCPVVKQANKNPCFFRNSTSIFFDIGFGSSISGGGRYCSGEALLALTFASNVLVEVLPF